MKILIISHNCITTYHNMGKTFLSLFSAFEKSEICHLYIYPTIPDIDVCSAYYRVTDKDVLDSFFKLKAPGGEVTKEKIATAKASLFEDEKIGAIYRKEAGNKTPLKRLLRDTMWKMSRWYTKELEQFVKREKPTHIFLAPANAMFIYDVALKISKKFSLPIVTYICDDYYFVDKKKAFLDELYSKLLKRKTKKIMSKTSHLIAICEDIRREYSSEFSVPATVVMTGATCPVAETKKISDNPKRLSYFGNLTANRNVSLAKIGKMLDAINSERDTDYTLEIYTGHKKKELFDVFEGIKSIKLCGFVTGKEFENTFNSSELLVHVEGFDKESMDRVKHSVSTKIADSLAVGIPLVAFAPESLASMKHLIENKCALTAVSEQALKDMLLSAFEDKALLSETVENAIETARKYHIKEKNSLAIKNIFENIN